jgi:hypothetical protein
MKATKLIKEIINDLILENAKQYSDITQLEKELEKSINENRKLQSELNYRDNTVEIKM